MLKNVGSNWVLNGLQILVLMVLAPFIVETLGKDGNGVWVTVVSLTGFLSLLILGVPMASVRFIAEEVAKNDTAGTNRAISTCLGICLMLGGAALIAGAALCGVFELVYLRSDEWSSLSAETLDDARIAFIIVVLQVAAGFLMRLPYGIFDAHGDFVLRNAILAFELVLKLVLTLLLVSWNASLTMLASVQVLCMVTEFVVARMVISRRYPELKFALGSFDRAMVRSVLSFSVFALLLNVGSMLAFRTDAMVIGAHLETAQITFYDMGNKFFEPLVMLVLGIAQVAMPAATHLKASGEQVGLEELFLKWSKIALSLTLCIGVYLLTLGPAFLGWWIDPEYVEPSGRVLQVLMISFLVFLPVRGVALPVLMGLGKPGLPALALLVMGAVNVGISIALVEPYGILGVALGTAIPNVLFAVTVLILACRELDVSLARYVGYVWLRATIGALPVLALGLALQRAGVGGFLGLMLSGVAMVALFAVVWVAFVYRNDPLVDMSGALARIRGRGASRGDPPS